MRLWFSKSAHPSREDLVLFVENELPARQWRRVRAHLDDCWNCRVEHETVERAIHGFVAARNAALESGAACGPDLRRRVLAAVEHAAQTSRPEPSRPQPMFRLRTQAALAAALLAATALWLRIGSVPQVSAKEALERASQAMGREAAAPPLIVVRRRSGATASESGAEVERGLEKVLRENGLAGPSPLSPAALLAWRNSIRIGRETALPSRLADGEDALTVEIAAQGPFRPDQIVMVRYQLRTRDWKPVRQWVSVYRPFAPASYEIEPRPPARAANAAASLPAPPEAAPASSLPLPAALALPPEDEMRQTEVEARYIVHQLGACLNDPVLVARHPGAGILVSGVVEDDAQRRRLRSALDGLPHLRVELKTLRDASGARAGRRTPRAAGDLLLGPSESLVQKDLVRYASSHVAAADVALEISRLSNLVVSRSGSALAHAWALRRLAADYPSDRVAGLRLSGRRLVEVMVHDHAEALKDSVGKSGALLREILPGVVPAPSPLWTVAAADAWQDQAGVILEQVRRSDRLSRGLFAGLELTAEEKRTAAATLVGLLPSTADFVPRFEAASAGALRGESLLSKQK